MAQYSRKLKKGIRWWYKFDYSNQTYSSSCIYLSKNEAKKAEAEKLRGLSLEVQTLSQKPVLSLIHIINERLDLIKIKKSKIYYNESKRYLSILLQHFDDIPIDKISKSEIEKLLMQTSQRQQEKGKDNYAVNSMIRCYKSLFNYVIDTYEDLKLKNPVRKISFYPVEKKLKYIPTDKEIQSVISICDNNQKSLIQFIEETGARINECLNLKGKDVLENHIVLYTRKSKNSNRVPRKLPKPECLKGLLFENEKFIFGTWSEQPKFLERKIKQLNLTKWGFHNLRHRRASIWSKENKPIFEIMSLLGHSNISTTQKYLQLL